MSPVSLWLPQGRSFPLDLVRPCIFADCDDRGYYVNAAKLTLLLLSIRVPPDRHEDRPVLTLQLARPGFFLS